jgi:hypothetical protein
MLKGLVGGPRTQGTKMTGLRNRLPLKILVPLIAIAALSIGSFATTVSITTSTYQAQAGVQYVVTGAFTATSNGFQVVQATLPASATPTTWASGGTFNTALTAGDWQYSVTLKLNTVPGSTTTYTYTVEWNTGSGTSQLCQLTISVPNTATANSQMTGLCDAGASFNAPSAITITVA